MGKSNPQPERTNSKHFLCVYARAAIHSLCSCARIKYVATADVAGYVQPDDRSPAGAAHTPTYT